MSCFFSRPIFPAGFISPPSGPFDAHGIPWHEEPQSTPPVPPVPRRPPPCHPGALGVLVDQGAVLAKLLPGLAAWRPFELTGRSAALQSGSTSWRDGGL